MIIKRIVKRKTILIASFALFMISFLIGLFFLTNNLQKSFERKIFDISTNDITAIAKNVASEISKFSPATNKNILEYIKSDSVIQEAIEAKLIALLTNNIKYSYLIYKDEKNIFRFLVDASSNDEKAYIGQKFDVDSKEWLEIYETKQPIFIQQEHLSELSVTYLVPIIEANEVQMILVIDFAVEKIQDIDLLIEKIKYIILGIIAIILVFITILAYQGIRFYLLKKSAYIDRLTNIYNRNYLQDYQEFINLDDYILCAIDIDHFKKINDTYGHNIGDKILKELSLIMWREIRKHEDILIRYGGEEFCLLIKQDKHNNASGLNLLERVFLKVKDYPFEISQNEQINVTISVGVNLAPGRQRDFTSAFKLADIALYNAKNKGRNKIEIYSEHVQNESFLTINEIKDAIDEKRIFCLFQAIVDTNSQEISHYEALIRLKSEDGIVITPEHFLKVTQGTFIARNLTKEVLQICFEHLRSKPNIHITVNLNPQDLTSQSILAILKDFSKVPKISNRLGLEIIESEEIMNYEQAQKNILMLKAIGYQIYIDDFGSGYSNFIYLAKINANVIKIDGSIIKNIATDKLSYLVAKNIINFAKEANIETIAEFVCDEKIYKIVKDLGVDKCQGYYFSKPSEL